MNNRIKSFKYAIKGILNAFEQPNMLIHLVIAFLVILAGLALNISHSDWNSIMLAIGFVLTAESFNTAIEKLTDLVSPQHNLLAGQVKDIAAGAVLISAVTASIIGLFVFIPEIISLFKVL